MEDFTPEERKYMNMKLAEADEWQKKCGNKTHTHEEVMEKFMKLYSIKELER